MPRSTWKMGPEVARDLVGASFFLLLLLIGSVTNWHTTKPTEGRGRVHLRPVTPEAALLFDRGIQEEFGLWRVEATQEASGESSGVQRAAVLGSGRRLLASEEEAPAPPGESAKEKQKRLMDRLVAKWRDDQTKRDKKDLELMPNRTIVGGATIGPKIVDWDDQRRDYLKKHPGCNQTRYGRPKMLMITGSQMAVCGNDVGDFLNLKALKNKIDYCDPRDIPIYVSLTILDKLLDSFWVKLPLLRKMMLTHPEIEWFWWMDSDAIFTDMFFDIPLEKYDGYDFVLHGWEDAVYDRRDWVGLNAGVFLMRNSQWSLDFLDAWGAFGVKGPLRKIWGLKLTQDLTNRPVFDSDDQSVLVWMFYYQKEQWAHKVFLEHTYYLHGYWVILTQRYEELMDKYHPGHGDHRWPLITHFVGCKPCSKVGALVIDEMKKCVEGMERAFNFADNQVLRKFGYQHLHLDTYQVVRINVTTYKASEFHSHPLKKWQVGE